eukprot:127185_1
MRAEIQTYKIIFFSIELIVVWFIILPLLAYYTILYHKARNTTQLSKRNTTLVITTSICCICYSTIGRTIAILRQIIVTLQHKSAIEIIDNILWIVPMFSLLNILFFRSFTLNFIIRYNMNSEKGLWIQHINIKSTQQINWYYTHRNSIGNINWIMKRIFIPFLIIQFVILFTFSRITNIISNFYYYTAIAIFLLLLIIAIWIIYLKTPFYADIFQLREELKRVLYIGFIGFLSFVTFTIIDGIGLVPIWYYRNSVIGFCLLMIHEILVDLVFFGISMVSTYWVLKNTIQMNKYYKTLHKNTGDRCKPKLKQCLSEYVTFQAFMSHLCKEFSSENLLFLYEVSQYKKHFDSISLSAIPKPVQRIKSKSISETVQNQFNKTQSISSLSLEDEQLFIEFAEEIPNSDIVYNKEISIYDKVMELNKKYIVVDSVLEVNLPYLMRVTILNKCQHMNGLEMTELYHVFDAAIREILLLIGDSFSRFVMSKEYAVLNVNK